jgi:hypothetical protein
MFDDTSNGPLTTSAAKIRIAYALGIVDENAKREMDLIRHIRNNFAHPREHTDFSTPEIVNACNNLYLPNQWHLAGLGGRPPDPKSRFHTSVEFLFLYLESPKGSAPKRYEEVGLFGALLSLKPRA